jgi:hypothetical protein
VRNMILPLIAIVEQPQVFLGTGEVIFDAAPRPFVVRVRGYAIAHDAGDKAASINKGINLSSGLRDESSNSIHHETCAV